jgi:hypothetical protein
MKFGTVYRHAIIGVMSGFGFYVISTVGPLASNTGGASEGVVSSIFFGVFMGVYLYKSTRESIRKSTVRENGS